MRTRKLIGTVLLLLFLVIYSLVVMALAGPMLSLGYKYIEPLFFCLAGFLWVPPAALIIWWMSQPDASTEGAER